MTIRNVTIGDKYKERNSPHIFEVVDFTETRSMLTGKVVKQMCVVKGVNTMSSNTHEVSFATVVRSRIINPENCDHDIQAWVGKPRRRICQMCLMDRTDLSSW